MSELQPTSRREGIICTYGELVLDLVAILEAPLPQGGQISGALRQRLGGCAANVAISLVNQGVPARLIGREGDGPARAAMVALLKGQGVDLRTFRKGRYITSLGIHFVSGDTAFISDDKGAGDPGPDDIRPEWLDDAAVVHVTGYDLFEPRRRKLLDRVIDIAHSRKIPISLDVALCNEVSWMGADSFRSMLEDIAPVVVFCNEAEADAMNLAVQYPGAAGLVVEHRSLAPTRIHFPDGRRIEVPVTPSERYADAVGAGDAFAAGFLAGLVEGEDAFDCVQRAHRSALTHLQRVVDNHGYLALGL